MDNLETLFNKKEYELVLKLTSLSNDPKELLMRVSCLTILGKTDEALDEIEKNQSVIEKVYQYRLMKLHFELLLSKRLFDEARIALKHYEDLPYVSQEVEEFMREMSAIIEDEAHPKGRKTYDFDEICNVLENETENSKISDVVFNLKNYNLNICIDSLKIFIKRENVNPNFRTYGLILLIDEKFDEEVEFLSRDGLIKVVPNKLNPPFMSESFNSVCKWIVDKSNKNVSLTETALHLFNCYIIDTYPKDIYEIECDKLAAAFVYIARIYLGEKDIEENEEITKLANEIKQIIESTPEIRL